MHRNPCPPGCNPVSTIYGTRVKTASMFANTHSGGFSSKERAGYQQPRRLGPEAAQRRGGDSSRCGMRRVSCLCMDQCRTTSVLVGIDGVPVIIWRPCTSHSENGGLSRGQMASVRVRGKASGITGMAAGARRASPHEWLNFTVTQTGRGSPALRRIKVPTDLRRSQQRRPCGRCSWQPRKSQPEAFLRPAWPESW